MSWSDTIYMRVYRDEINGMVTPTVVQTLRDIYLSKEELIPELDRYPLYFHSVGRWDIPSTVTRITSKLQKSLSIAEEIRDG